MNPISLEWKRCPAGVHVVIDQDGRQFECLSEPTEDVRYEIGNLEDLLAVRFVNATAPDVLRKQTSTTFRRERERRNINNPEGRKLPLVDIDAGFTRFFSEWGLPIPGRSMEWRWAHDQRDEIYRLLLHASESPSTEAVANFNSIIKKWEGYAVLPTLRSSGVNGILPTLTYSVGNLLAYMAIECALVAHAGAKAKHCDWCMTLFLHGPLTGRRSTAEFCTDRCRQASLRNGKKGK